MFLNWQLSLLALVALFITYDSYVTFSEEFLIIAASFFWIDAAGSFFIASLTDLLCRTKLLLKNYFTTLLVQKKDHLMVVLATHLKRLTLVNELLLLFSIYSKTLFSIFFKKLFVAQLYLFLFSTLVVISEAVVALFKRYFYFSTVFVV